MADPFRRRIQVGQERVGEQTAEPEADGFGIQILQADPNSRRVRGVPGVDLHGARRAAEATGAGEGTIEPELVRTVRSQPQASSAGRDEEQRRLPDVARVEHRPHDPGVVGDQPHRDASGSPHFIVFANAITIVLTTVLVISNRRSGNSLIGSVRNSLVQPAVHQSVQRLRHEHDPPVGDRNTSTIHRLATWRCRERQRAARKPTRHAFPQVPDHTV